MELLIDQDEYLRQSTSASAGIRVQVTDPGSRPNPTDSGFYVKPGSEADLAYRLQVVTRMEAPYQSDCWNSWTSTPYQPLYHVQAQNVTKVIDGYSYDVS